MTTTSENLEQGRLLFAAPCDFVMGVVEVSQLPDSTLPEVCFAGRSNVGKSSLVNALTGRKTLARTSNTPGRTQEVNFFNLADQLMLVDLPGYGYAKVSRTQVQGWNKMVRDYLKGRVPLRLVCVLVDARHGLKDSDVETLKILDVSGVASQVVLTKADKCKDEHLSDLKTRIEGILKKHPAAFPEIMITSAHADIGIAALRARLAGLCC